MEQNVMTRHEKQISKVLNQPLHLCNEKIQHNLRRSTLWFTRSIGPSEIVCYFIVTKIILEEVEFTRLQINLFNYPMVVEIEKQQDAALQLDLCGLQTDPSLLSTKEIDVMAFGKNYLLKNIHFYESLH